MATTESSEPAPDADLETACREAEAVAALQLLNAGFVRALLCRDAEWYLAHLRDDFVCILADGRRIAKHEYVRRTAAGMPAHHVDCDEVDVHALGDVALVRGVIHARKRGSLAVTRYTTVWQLRRERWQAVAAQFTPVKMLGTRGSTR